MSDFKTIEVVETVSRVWRIDVPNKCLEGDKTHAEYLEEAINHVGMSNVCPVDTSEIKDEYILIDGEELI